MLTEKERIEMQEELTSIYSRGIEDPIDLETISEIEEILKLDDLEKTKII